MNLVQVRRLTVHCTVPRDHPTPEKVRWRMDDVARGPLKEALEHVLAPLARAQGEEIVVLRTLEMSFDLDVSQNENVLAERWAAQIAKAMIEVWKRGSDQRGLARFVDEASFLGRYLVDRADGYADEKWFYRRYSGWSALPVSASLRSAILDDASRGVGALGSVSAEELARILEALGEREAQRIVRAWMGDDPSEVDCTAAAEAILERAEVWRPRISSCASAWTAAMTIVASAVTRTASLDTKSVATVAAAIASASFRARAIEGGAPSALDAPPMAEAMRPLHLDRRLRERIEATLHPDARAHATSTTDSTRFGGLLLLFRHLAELPIDSTWSDPVDRARARLVILSRCVGAGRAHRVVDDALMRKLLGVPDAPSNGELQSWIAAQSEVLERSFFPALVDFRQSVARLPAMRADEARTAESILEQAAQTVLESFARRLPGFSRSSPEFLYENFLDFTAVVDRIGANWICRVHRPRLAAVLLMTGALRGMIIVPWLDDGVALELRVMT